MQYLFSFFPILFGKCQIANIPIRIQLPFSFKNHLHQHLCLHTVSLINLPNYCIQIHSILLSVVFVCEHYPQTYFRGIIEKKQAEIEVCRTMIKYDRLWQTMEKRGITQYDLYTHYNVNRSQINRLKHNRNVEVNTIDRLCNILNCNVEDIMEHFPDKNSF